MSITLRVAATMVATLFTAAAAEAQVRPYPAGCTPRPPNSTPSDAPLIVGAQDPSPKTLYGPGDLLIINAGTARDVYVGQRYYVRRHVESHLVTGPQPIITTGGVRIIAANETTAIGQVDLGCDGMTPGDYLEPAPTSLEIDNRIAESDLDFSSPSRVLYGDYGKVNGANGDVMFADIGTNTEPGSRYAVFRDLNMSGVPLAPIGEVVVVATGDESMLVRVTKVRDSVNAGDLLIPRKR
jgi:hypothetical protein